MSISDNSGRRRKAVPLFTIEVTYKSQSAGRWEVCLFRMINYTMNKVMEFRSTVISHGARRVVEDGIAEIIVPWNIISIFIYRQERMFTEEEGKMPLTREDSNISPYDFKNSDA